MGRPRFTSPILFWEAVGRVELGSVLCHKAEEQSCVTRLGSSLALQGWGTILRFKIGRQSCVTRLGTVLRYKTGGTVLHFKAVDSSGRVQGDGEK